MYTVRVKKYGSVPKFWTLSVLGGCYNGPLTWTLPMLGLNNLLFSAFLRQKLKGFKRL